MSRSSKVQFKAFVKSFIPEKVDVPNANILLLTFLIFGNLLFRFELVIAPALLIGFLSCIIIFFYNRKIHTIGFLVILNYSYWFLSGYLTGGLVISDLANFEFINRDGRIFVYYIPLIIFSIVKLKRKEWEYAARLFDLITIILIVPFLSWSLLGVNYFTGSRGHYFFGFHTSHNAAGTFMGALAIFHLFYWLEAHQRKNMILFVFSLLMVFATGSREALFAAVAVGLWFFSKNLLKLRSFIFILVAVGLIAILPFVAERTYERTRGIFTEEVFRDIAKTIELTNWNPGVDKEDRDLPGENVNIMSRIAYWKYGVLRIIDSPFIGIGFGRWNDPYPVWRGIKHLAYVSTEAPRVFHQYQAHNSYIHIWAENGLLGIILIGLVWLKLFKYFKRKYDLYQSDPHKAAYFKAAQGIVIFTLVAANFGHALAAPAIGLIVTTMLGIGISLEDEKIEEKVEPQ